MLLCFVRTNAMFTSSKEVKGRTHTYYQVLIDSRDMPHIVRTTSLYYLLILIFILLMTVEEQVFMAILV